MAPKAGGSGNKSAQNYVSDLWQQGLSEQAIRQRLKENGYKAGRITQLLKATRPNQGQEGVGDAAAAPKAPARPLKRPAAASSALSASEEAGRVRQPCQAASSGLRFEGHARGQAVLLFRDSEASDSDDEVQQAPVAFEDGESTDAESEDSNEELNVHHFIAGLDAELEELQARTAELDHTDWLGLAPSPEDEDAVSGAETEKDLDAPEANETSDEEMEAAEATQAARPPEQPRRRRLTGKQPPTAAYRVPPAAARPKQVLKRPGMLKRPASARGKRPNELYRKYRGEVCQFDPQNPGQPAGVHPNRGVERRNLLTAALHKFAEKSAAVLDAALRRIRLFLGNAAAQTYVHKVEARQKKQEKQKEHEKNQPPPATWQECLEHRKNMDRPLKESQRSAYEALVRRDQRVARRKFFFPEKLHNSGRVSEETEAAEKAAVQEACGAIGHEADNDTDLPLPSDDKGKMVEAWCKQGSWGICTKCHSMQARPLTPMDLKRVNKPTIPPSQCTACKHGEYVPQPEHVPEPLRNLKPRVLEALRPLERDIGFVERVPHGYRVHNAMMAFAWKERSVQHAIRNLGKSSDRRAARAAPDCLLSNKDSAYKEILDKHQEFLNKEGNDAPLQKRKRPLRFIETEGLECCIWPQLYWHRNMCETMARASHENRATAKAAAARRRRAADTSSEEEAEGEAAEDAASNPEKEDFAEDSAEDPPNIVAAEHGRIKRGFMRKVLSPVIGYSSDYELLHFVFDLSMWTTIGTKKNLATRTGVALRHLLKGSPWTPQYWRVRHHAVLDMQRQCGNASLFRTRAPYERSFPYRQWVMHEQRVLGKERQHLAGPETLHMAWVLLQLDKGYICGDKYSTNQASRNWKDHVLGPENEESNRNTVVAHVTRLEFQDGKRKQASQKYHGRGTTHSPSLDFLENVEAIGLERKLQATIPSKDTEPFLHGLVMDSQRDYKDSKLPVRAEPSAWNPETGSVALHHTEEDKAEHVRAYLKPTMEITKCHEDVQQADANNRRNGAHLRYVATYDMKFSSSIDSEWLNGQGSDYSTAVGVLRQIRVLEPEMWLTLAQERFPQADLSGTMLDIMAPNFENLEEKKPNFVESYEEASWRRNDMSLLEFLRKSNKDGDIINCIVEKHKQHVMQQVQGQTGEGDKAFAKIRKDLLSRWNKHKKTMKEAGDDPLELAEFLAEEPEAYGDLTSLTDFANGYKTRGEKLIAATTNSMLNDRYYAQWLALNKPFRRLEDFQEQAPEVMEKVTVKYRNFALCLHHSLEFWYDDKAIQAQMELEAHSTAFVNTILNKVRAHRHIVQWFRV
eukprot:s5512_g1.t1